MRVGSLFVAVVVLGVCGAARAQTLGCLIEPKEVVEVGSPVVGVLDQIEVERGDTVAKGQSIARLRGDVEREAVSLAETKSRTEAELQAAAAAHEYAKRKHERQMQLYSKNFISFEATDQSRTELELAEKKLFQARDQRRLATQELSLARAQLAQRTIRSPIAGVVVERYMSQGERVEEKPIVKVATLDPLRVEVIMPAAEFTKIRAGMAMNVMPELPNAASRVARLTLGDRVIDAASNTFRVRMELPNPDDALPAGLRCKVALATEKPTQGEAKTKTVAPSAMGNKLVEPAKADKSAKPTTAVAAPTVTANKGAKPVTPVMVPTQAPAIPRSKPVKAVTAAPSSALTLAEQK